MYKGYEYRLNKRCPSFSRADGLLIRQSNKQYRFLLEYVKKNYPNEITRFAEPKELKVFKDDYKSRHKPVTPDTINEVVHKRNEISWANHMLSVKSTKTRETKDGHRVYIGNLLIIVPDAKKINSVRKRFENHESNKFKL